MKPSKISLSVPTAVVILMKTVSKNRFHFLEDAVFRIQRFPGLKTPFHETGRTFFAPKLSRENSNSFDTGFISVTGAYEKSRILSWECFFDCLLHDIFKSLSSQYSYDFGAGILARKPVQNLMRLWEHVIDFHTSHYGNEFVLLLQ